MRLLDLRPVAGTRGVPFPPEADGKLQFRRALSCLSCHFGYLKVFDVDSAPLLVCTW